MTTPVVVSRDGMEARLAVDAIPGEDLDVQLASLIESLRAANVRHGICQETLKSALAASRERNTPVPDVLAARGSPPVAGEDARIEFMFERAPSIGAHIGDDDHIDYHERGYLHPVAKGQLLARKIPATPGTPGRDVYGNALAPARGKDLAMKAAGDAAISTDGAACHATADGVAVAVEDAKIAVYEKYTVPGDVDLRTGNIEMHGALEIQGWIRAGFRVHASGDIVVKGGIEPADVQADANLSSTGGIMGSDETRLRVGNGLTAQYIENAAVSAGGDVTVTTGIVNSRVHAGGRVTAARGAGSIVGGLVCALRGVEVNQIGSPGGVPTVVEAGMDSDTRSEFNRLEQECALYARNAPRIEKALALFRQHEGGRKLRDREKTAAERLVQFQRQAREMHARLNALWKTALAADATVIVNRAVYQGSCIYVSGRRYDVVDDMLKPCEFRLDPLRQVVDCSHPKAK